MNSSRRYFLKIAGLTTFALAGGVGCTVAARAALDSAKPGNGAYSAAGNAMKARRFVMVIDTSRFNTPESRRKVMDACRRAHNVPSIPGPQEVKWIWDDAFAHVFADDAGFLPEDLEKRRYFLLCNHCANPSCVRVCPAGATYLTEHGLVAIDYHRCVGCRFCMAACPYGSRSFNFQDPRPFLDEINAAYPTRMRGVVEKCTFCAERLEKGQMPVCAEVSDGAILFGDIGDPESSVRRALAQRFSVRRRPDLGTDPGVYYLI